MSSYMSNQIIVGNLGRDPEMRYTPSGKPVTDFSVAVNRQYTGANGQTVRMWSGSKSPPGASRPKPATSF